MYFGVIKMEKRINENLMNYVENELYPIYETFDRGHDVNHIHAVIERALDIAKTMEDIDINIVYASAALHDIGIKVERKNHAIHSAEFVLTDPKLKKFFTEEEIKLIANAVEDHSTSKGIEPRSIYGKIVCDADKDDDLEISLLRAYEWTKKYMPELTEEECIKNVYNQMVFKFGTEGKVQFWINTPKQRAFLEQMRALSQNEEQFMECLHSILTSDNRTMILEKEGTQDV